MNGERGEIGRLRVAGEVWLTSAAVVVLELLVSARYGFHRDELYFLVAGRRLDWGFVDQPPLTPLLARISEMIGGTSTVAIRVLPALAVGAVVLVAAATARRFGAGRRAQWLAGLMAGGTGYALAVGHLMSTATFDYLLWSVALWLLVGLLDGDEPRRWAVLGVVVGIGMQNKHLIAFLAVAVLIAIVATSQRRILAGVWPWVGALLAILIALPNLIWQASNSFPQLEMADALAARSDGPIAFVLEQVGLLSIVLVVPLAAGLWRLLRSRELLRWRPIGIAFVLLFVFFLVSGGKSYYVAGMYPVLLAAGARWFDDLNPGKQQGMVRSAAVGIAIGTLIALPIIPVAWIAGFDATGELGETAGWPELIDQIDGVYQSIPADLRSGTIIFTGSYGEAGAVDVLGLDRGLPAASSGHNSYWLWGPPDTHGPIIGVGGIGETLRAICPTIQQVATISNPWAIGNEEMGLPLWLCVAPRGQLADIWPDVKHYN